jgi:hypothetical protein
MLNALLMGERRKRLTPELIQAFIEDLQRLPMFIPIRTRFSQRPRRFAVNTASLHMTPPIWRLRFARTSHSLLWMRI